MAKRKKGLPEAEFQALLKSMEEESAKLSESYTEVTEGLAEHVRPTPYASAKELAEDLKLS